ncbi:PD-(D/E)XK nuclease family protein [Leeuwenhoekiella sp. W20_SRS_FM14]|uniref:PD-(D/E)XK nuclease family protein n=1 Tax=Leeuwenhoekiella sp. W20_SRS_FM14 TaxID=3240270 RepID=UPI003F989220
MTEKFEELQDFLDNTEIPIVQPKPLTFLEIAKQPHYENVLSNIYAFYFDVNGEHGFKELFVSVLVELRKEKLGITSSKFENFFEFAIDTEYSTHKKGRIDILLHNEEQAIIIENKVYHHIDYNDLDDYWDSVKVAADPNKNKIGIIMSLFAVPDYKYQHHTNAKHYINITHKEFLQRIIKNSGPYLLEASDKYTVFLKDLAQNIYNMSTKALKPQEIEFYKNHKDDLLKAKKFFERVETYVVQEIETTLNLIDKDLGNLMLKGKGRDRLRYAVSKRNPDLMFTVGFDHLWDNANNRLNVIVELQGNALKDRSIYSEIEFSEEEKKIIANTFYQDTNKNWCHFATKHYSEEMLNFQNLSGYLVDKMKEDHLISIFKKLDDFLTQYRSKP